MTYVVKFVSSPFIYILSSLNGVDESGEVDWTGCRNVKLRRLETATAFAHYIEVGHFLLEV